MILITGGAGFIGSHMAGFLLSKNIDFVLLDNFSNSNINNISLLESFFKKKIKILNVDLRNISHVENLFHKYNFSSVIHFAALKSVEESIKYSNLYFDNNVSGSKNLINIIKKFKIKNFIFSSSACVYGEPNYLPIDEDHPLNPSNPYAQSKADVENLILFDKYFIDDCRTSILRYFNPIGSFFDHIIGENPIKVPSNLMPYIVGVSLKIFPYLKIFGDDYKTNDGTAIRDYVHVMDLVEAHYAVLNLAKVGVQVYNIGTGNGISVRQLLFKFSEINNVQVPFKIYPRRAGDSGAVYSSVNKINKKLNWRTRFNLDDMCRDAYLFAQKNIKKKV